MLHKIILQFIDVFKIVIIIGSILILVTGCSNSTGDNTSPESNMTFFASKIDGSNETYTLDANLLAFSDHSAVYVEEGTNISTATGQAIVNLFESNIYNNVRTYFAYESDVDNNGRIILLLLDIVDGYDPLVGGGYVAGYFYSYHIFNLPESNKADMIYLDTNPLVPGSDEFMDTIAHEFQHLVNFAENSLRGTGPQDLWINEGLSSAAEYLYKGEHKLSRLDYYNAYPTSSISRGNNFFVWNGPEGDVLADYSTVYIFFQWLRIQASNGAAIYKDIMDNLNKDYLAVEESMESRIYGGSIDWSDIIRDWYLSIYYNNSSGLYGFKSEFSLVSHIIPGITDTTSLLPSESIFDIISVSFTPSLIPDGSYFVGIEGPDLDEISPDYDGSVLLAGNGSNNKSGLEIETSIFASYINSSSSQDSLKILASVLPDPYKISSYPIGVSFPNPGSGKIKRDDE